MDEDDVEDAIRLRMEPERERGREIGSGGRKTKWGGEESREGSSGGIEGGR